MRWLLAILIVILLLGCEVKYDPEPVKWKPGDMVRVIISGDRAMVIDVFARTKYYRVRLAPHSQMTDSGLLSDDTSIERLPLMLFQEFELTDLPKESEKVERLYDGKQKDSLL